VGFLQWRTFERQAQTLERQSKILESQTEVQRLTSQANIAPSYLGKRDDGKLIIDFKNTGLLPALGVSIAKKTGIRPPLSTSELVAFCAAPEESGERRTVHPGASIEEHVDYPEFSDNGQAEDELYYACGSANYTDAQGTSRDSYFCYTFDRTEVTTEYDHTLCTLPEPGAAADTAADTELDNG